MLFAYRWFEGGGTKVPLSKISNRKKQQRAAPLLFACLLGLESTPVSIWSWSVDFISYVFLSHHIHAAFGRKVVNNQNFVKIVFWIKLQIANAKKCIVRTTKKLPSPIFRVFEFLILGQFSNTWCLIDDKPQIKKILKIKKMKYMSQD